MAHQAVIHAVMEHLKTRLGGCVGFDLVAGDPMGDWVLVTATGGGKCLSKSCCSELGHTRGRPQVLQLDPEGCMHNVTITHELLHTIGTPIIY